MGTRDALGRIAGYKSDASPMAKILFLAAGCVEDLGEMQDGGGIKVYSLEEGEEWMDSMEGLELAGQPQVAFHVHQVLWVASSDCRQLSETQRCDASHCIRLNNSSTCTAAARFHRGNLTVVIDYFTRCKAHNYQHCTLQPPSTDKPSLVLVRQGPAKYLIELLGQSGASSKSPVCLVMRTGACYAPYLILARTYSTLSARRSQRSRFAVTAGNHWAYQSTAGSLSVMIVGMHSSTPRASDSQASMTEFMSESRWQTRV
ncbi:hypothetical protein G7046_g8311 [Stylonectria norvegica]|nr:hypothetical protein G7046_g8311 [Stylonectria norvegica]